MAKTHFNMSLPRVRLCPRCGGELSQKGGCKWECLNPGCPVIYVRYEKYSLDLVSIHVEAETRERYR